MKVRRYFVGFGPTLWSTRRPNKLGYTEYGVKAIPLGGFCDIAGMTSIDEIAPEDEPYAMYKQKTWKRVAVLVAGPAMNFVIGLVLIYAIAVIWGLPNLHPPTEAMVGETSCVKSEVTKGELGDCEAPAPAAAAGIQAGDVVVKVGDTPSRRLRRDGRRGAQARRSDPVHRASATATEFTTVVDVTQATALGRVPTPPSPATSAPSASAARGSGRRSTTRCRRCPPRSRSPATWPSSWASRWRRSRPRSARWCTPSAAVNAIRRRRSAWSAPASSAATPSSTGCGWRSGSSWPS